MGFWLYAIPPTVAASLSIICSSISQLQTLHLIWRTIRWRRVLIFVVPGLLGVPVGTYVLPHINPTLFRIGVGVFLVGYSCYVLLRRGQIKSDWGGSTADGVIGFGGGILGGIAGLSGVFPIIWTDIRGWIKEERRSVVQSFNIAILWLALASHAASGLLTRQVLLAGGDRAAWNHRRRPYRRFHLSQARRSQLSARHPRAAVDFGRDLDLDQPLRRHQ